MQIPAYCRLCLKAKICTYDEKWEIKNNGHDGNCSQFVLTVGRLNQQQFNRFNEFYEQHQKSWNRELELSFTQNLVNSANYR